jgi:hypothetical protein
MRCVLTAECAPSHPIMRSQVTSLGILLDLKNRRKHPKKCSENAAALPRGCEKQFPLGNSDTLLFHIWVHRFKSEMKTLGHSGFCSWEREQYTTVLITKTCQATGGDKDLCFCTEDKDPEKGKGLECVDEWCAHTLHKYQQMRGHSTGGGSVSQDHWGWLQQRTSEDKLKIIPGPSSRTPVWKHSVSFYKWHSICI